MAKKTRLPLFLLALIAWGCPGATPQWIEHASMPGPNTPELGQSRFDQLFLLEAGHYGIPYPFASLIEFLDAQIDNADHSGVRQVFIPSGRSLQRDAPAPDHFSFPRIVIALEGEPVTAVDEAGQVLEYRLFIAHQPKTETLEVISYNDAIGRFEFQIVTNYAANRQPRVQAANRAMCLSCHQNAAPIFAKSPWSETSFNVEVANQLIATLPQQYKSLIGIVTGDAGVIDVLSERANYLGVAQLIWQLGCSSRPCRAAMLRAILQYRLSGEGNFDVKDERYWKDYYTHLTQNWKTRWPNGLALANSRIIDRDPFSPTAMTFEHEALFPRPAHATWAAPDPVLASGIIYRLAGFLTLADIQRIDRHLSNPGDIQSSLIHQQQVSCELSPNNTSSHVLSCGENSTPAGLQAVFEIEFQQDEPQVVRVVQLHAPHDTNILQPDIVHLEQVQGGINIVPGNKASALSLRLANGNRIKSLQLRWDESMVADQTTLTVEIATEFQLLDQALMEMLHNNQRGSDGSLDENVFQRQAIMRELMEILGLQTLQWPNDSRPSLVATRPDLPELDGNLALLEPYCGHCHADDSVNPPGFLFNDQPLARIKQCAPRILGRLKAWHTKSAFSGSPMPPPASLAISGTTIDDWPYSDHYHSLVASIEKLVSADLIDRDYQQLPACLPVNDE